jgi:hypothetical protein
VDNQVRLQLFALAYNLGNFLRRLALPRGLKWTMTTLREKLVKIGAKVVRSARYVTFQLAEVAVSRELFAIATSGGGMTRSMGRTTSETAKQLAKMGMTFLGRRFRRVLWLGKGLKQPHERGQIGFTARTCVMVIAENLLRTVRGMATVPNRKSRVDNGIKEVLCGNYIYPGRTRPRG